MAVMKFLCDTKRCIECNGCVTACKNENDSALEWGIQRRRVVTINDGLPGEASISVACMHCTDAPCMAVCPADCFYRTEDGIVLHNKDTCIGCGYCFYACPFGAPQFPKKLPLVVVARWTSVLSAPVAQKKPSPKPSVKNTVPTVLLRASYLCVLSFVRQKPCSRVMRKWYPISTVNVWPLVAILT